MPTTPRKTAASKAAKLAAPAAAVELEKAGDLDALRAEVARNPDVADKPFAVPFMDTTVTVKAILDWPLSADELLAAMRFGPWAEKILDGDDYANVWVPADPTMRHLIKFVEDLEATTGIPFGLQYASPTN